MKLAVLDAAGARKGDVELPRQFSEAIRPDLITRAVHALQAAARQPYGADPEAGKRASAELSRRRRKYRGSYGFGMSRVPRKILSRRGTRMYMVGAFAPGTVGGRRAHPPKAEKQWDQKVNKRENRKAIRSALSATVDAATVKARGHKVPDSYPFLLDSSMIGISKTSEAKKALLALGFKDELARADKTTARAGKGKMRGRKTRRATSLLIVTAEKDVALRKAAANISGVEVVAVHELNAELLAPGTHPGRATLYTKDAIQAMTDGKLFLDTGKKPQTAKKKPVPVESEAAPADSTRPKQSRSARPTAGAKVEKTATKAKTAPKGEAA